MPDLELFADAEWTSPWVFHVTVALEELRVPYKIHTVPLPVPEPLRTTLLERAPIPKVPCLVDDDLYLTESSAISEYLAERFTPPAYGSIMPTNVRERARVRQVMSWVRTTSMALREARPTTSVFHRPVQTPLPPKAQAEAAELVRVATRWLEGKTSIASTWSIADADLALVLMRLVANGDPLPSQLADYALAQWGRTSVRRYLAYIPTTA